MNNNLKNMKGITLIALVITIIVLLILAGVSISMLTGQNGILTQAQNSKQATEKSEVKEKAHPVNAMLMYTGTFSRNSSSIQIRITTIMVFIFPDPPPTLLFLPVLFLLR